MFEAGKVYNYQQYKISLKDFFYNLIARKEKKIADIYVCNSLSLHNCLLDPSQFIANVTKFITHVLQGSSKEDSKKFFQEST